MTVRDRQVQEALATRKRQVERALVIDGLIEDEALRTHHGWGLEVKDHTGLALMWECEERLGEDDGEARAVYEGLQDAFWRDAASLAADYDFSGVHSAGRSGGYCLVSPQPHPDDMYPTDMDEFLRERLGPWALDIRELIKTLRDALEHELDALAPTSDSSQENRNANRR